MRLDGALMKVEPDDGTMAGEDGKDFAYSGVRRKVRLPLSRPRQG